MLPHRDELRIVFTYCKFVIIQIMKLRRKITSEGMSGQESASKICQLSSNPTICYVTIVFVVYLLKHRWENQRDGSVAD